LVRPVGQVASSQSRFVPLALTRRSVVCYQDAMRNPKKQIKINGMPVAIAPESDMPLLWFLREVVWLTGTKFGCGIAANLAQWERSCILRRSWPGRAMNVKDAPKVIARFGSMSTLVTQVLEPTIGNYFRNAAQGSDIIDFLKNRSLRQGEARDSISLAQ
jgi:hypothetical protein